ncbi:hypothetical protein HY634_04105 [Candidatus Uhrbacteria bacterium]|nr:hypothetical protein [Candidatus Uhrbacteria bacterium]
MHAKEAMTLAHQDGASTNELKWLDRGSAKCGLGPLAHIGIVREDLPRNGAIAQGMREAIVALGIEPLFFKDIGLVAEPDDVHTGVGYRSDGDRWYRMRRGATLIHDKAWRNWTRRSLAEYVGDENPIPERAVRILERLQVARLPIGCSIMVWTPDLNTHQQQELPDPLLVLELSNGTCIPLCRWNG